VSEDCLHANLAISSERLVSKYDKICERFVNPDTALRICLQYGLLLAVATMRLETTSVSLQLVSVKRIAGDVNDIAVDSQDCCTSDR
jgi:hypothetical protein